MAYYSHEEILKETNGGLDIILHLYPQANKCIDNNKHFKIRDENTASCTLKQMPDGNYIIADWGNTNGDGKTLKMNAIQAWMNEKGIEYKNALDEISEKFGIMPEEQLKEIRKPDFNKRAAKADEVDGEYYFDLYEQDEIPKDWIAELGPYAKLEKLKLYQWHAVKSYRLIKNREALIWSSKENYPIFVIKEDYFKKIYQPKAYDKKDRFRYAVDKGRELGNFLHGLNQAYQIFIDKNPHEADGYSESEEAAREKEEGGGKPKTELLEEIILCSGDRDALNVAGMGFFVVWKNSETSQLLFEDVKKMRKIAKRIYNVPDIDPTGILQGRKVGMFYLDIHTVWLPKELREKKDWRGNPRKDLLDFCEVKRGKASKEFKELLRVSYPFKFWDSYINKNNKVSWEIMDIYLISFLAHSGFYLYRKEGAKDDFVFIQVIGTQVRQVNAVDVKRFVTHFLYQKREDIRLRNYVQRAPQLKPPALTDLEEIQLDFRSHFPEGRIFYFKNGAFKITAEGIEKLKPGTINNHVWEEKILLHHFKEEKAFFTVKHTKDEEGKQIIEDLIIHNSDCEFFRYLIQTSRVHWRKELETHADQLTKKDRAAYLKAYKFSIDGPGLNADEIHEQKLHLVNKMYVIGYMLHRNRRRSRPWVPLAMDARLSDAGKSFGGSGKSLVWETGLAAMSRLVKINGKNKKVLQDDHLFTEVNKETDLVLFDDLDEYFDFRMMFTYTSGSFPVNPKFGKRFTLENDEAPILGGTTNFSIRDTSPSVRRRLIVMAFSDYYHLEGDDYRETRNPNLEFGHDILDEETPPEEWNRFYNFMMQCLQLYLTIPDKVEAPMGEIEKRNLRGKMGETFLNWAEVFFSPLGENLNKELDKKQLMKTFIDDCEIGKFKPSPQSFKEKLKFFCAYQGLYYNPNSNEKGTDRIIRKENGSTVEYVMLATGDHVDVLNSSTEETIPTGVDEQAVKQAISNPRKSEF
ncbi:hypothetical protein GBO34_00950 [Roseivirga pacifica]|uniref:hypothetical protein n=1 Tax=Roseivirga pacifica TaxID=1267423 RepID=UPI0020943E7F|nr:hypothetical protein [Roseivirga pacifica]MCO6367881.1 hypothetical protein [Roseivirga pacifica]MCO6377253.1 hypothetical protein [Roseivirga pacifica]